MIQSHLLFLAPENASQATPSSPPAVARPVKPLQKRRKTLKFGVSVLGNTIGFGAILAVCWFSIQLMQVIIIQ
jgi:hypothetical protein